jgi:hypothetical protein
MTRYLTKDRAALAAAIAVPLVAAMIFAAVRFLLHPALWPVHSQCPVLAIPPPALARELGHGRLAWVFWHRTLTPEQILGDQPKPPLRGSSLVPALSPSPGILREAGLRITSGIGHNGGWR